MTEPVTHCVRQLSEEVSGFDLITGVTDIAAAVCKSSLEQLSAK